MSDNFFQTTKGISKKLTILFFVMILSFILGWIAGVVIAFTPLSDYINQGLNLIFNTVRFTRDNFAILMGTIFFFTSVFVKFDEI